MLRSRYGRRYHFIVSLSTAALSRKKAASTGTSRENFIMQKHHKRHLVFKVKRMDGEREETRKDWQNIVIGDVNIQLRK